MKEITILSGKGGTGKTTLTAALASFADNTIFCDTDVDAADLHLVMAPTIRESFAFPGGSVARIRPEYCTGCGICLEHCRFDAISVIQGRFTIDPFRCEGCRLCERLCPEKAISSSHRTDNRWFVSETRFGTLIHARMGPGEENSGRLVTQLRKKARELAGKTAARYILVDGPPGTGCPVIASVTGSDAVIMVIEPTLSGLHDARRLYSLVSGFGIPVCAMINKYDLHPAISLNVGTWLAGKKIPLLGKVPFDESIVMAMTEGKTIPEYAPGSAMSRIMEGIWHRMTLNLCTA